MSRIEKASTELEQARLAHENNGGRVAVTRIMHALGEVIAELAERSPRAAHERIDVQANAIGANLESLRRQIEADISAIDRGHTKARCELEQRLNREANRLDQRDASIEDQFRLEKRVLELEKNARVTDKDEATTDKRGLHGVLDRVCSALEKHPAYTADGVSAAEAARVAGVIVAECARLTEKGKRFDVACEHVERAHAAIDKATEGAEERFGHAENIDNRVMRVMAALNAARGMLESEHILRKVANEGEAAAVAERDKERAHVAKLQSDLAEARRKHAADLAYKDEEIDRLTEICASHAKTNAEDRARLAELQGKHAGRLRLVEQQAMDIQRLQGEVNAARDREDEAKAQLDLLKPKCTCDRNDASAPVAEHGVGCDLVPF